MERSTQPAPGRPRPSLLESASRPSLTGPYVDLSLVAKRARQERSEEMARLIGRFFAWIGAAIERARQRDLERPLSGATDLADLERRMRELEHGKGALAP